MCVLTGFGKNNHPQTLLNRLLLFVLFKFPSSFKRMLMGHERKRGCGLCEMSSQIDFGDQHGNRSCSQTWSCSQTGSSFVSLPWFYTLNTGVSHRFLGLPGSCSATQSYLTLSNPLGSSCKSPLSMGFSRQEYPGIEPVCAASSALQTDSLLLSHQGSPSLDFCL